MKNLSILLTLPIFVAASVPACELDNSQQAALYEAAGNPDVFTRHLSCGDIFLLAGCFNEARREFRAARAALEDESAYPSGDRTNRLKTAAEGSLQLVTALEDDRAGRTEVAKRKLIELLQTTELARLLHLVPFALADLGRRVELNEQEAALLESHLFQLSIRGHWKATAYLVDRRLAAGEAERALDEIETRLQGNLSTIDRIALQLGYADALHKAGRLLEAQLMLQQIEEEVAEKVIDPELRRYYLTVCLAVWESRNALAGTAESRRRVTSYRDALRGLPEQPVMLPP